MLLKKILKVVLTSAFAFIFVISTPVFALNSTIENLIWGSSIANCTECNNEYFKTYEHYGQSFINDPNGTGKPIKLDSWVFDFGDSKGVQYVSNLVLRIYAGNGNGGELIGSSTSTSITPVSGFEFPVTWNFDGRLQLVDNFTYTAVIAGGLPAIRVSGKNPYPDGFLTSGIEEVIIINRHGLILGNRDTVFRGNFSAL
jgi:hypothetical protein